MHIPKAFSMAATCAILAAGSIAVPAAAASPRLALVNGIPGKTVDVCIGNSEVKSGLRYGRWVEKTVSPGNRTVRFRNAAPGTCKGTTLAHETFEDIQANVDLTIIATAKSPKVVVFNNTSAPSPVGDVDWMAFRQASDIGSVIVSITSGEVIQPSAAPETFVKGQQWKLRFGSGTTIPISFAVYRPSKASPFAGPLQLLTYAPRRHEVVLVGTKTSNARLVTIIRATIAS